MNAIVQCLKRWSMHSWTRNQRSAHSLLTYCETAKHCNSNVIWNLIEERKRLPLYNSIHRNAISEFYNSRCSFFVAAHWRGEWDEESAIQFYVGCSKSGGGGSRTKTTLSHINIEPPSAAFLAGSPAVRFLNSAQKEPRALLAWRRLLC